MGAAEQVVDREQQALKLKRNSVVSTSTWVTANRQAALAAYNFNINHTLFVSFREGDGDSEVTCRFKDLTKLDRTVRNVCSEPGSISIRGWLEDGSLSKWHYIRGLTDEEIFDWIESGQLDDLFDDICYGRLKPSDG